MRRRIFIDSAVVVFAVALLASLAVHLPIYGALGVLADAIFSAEDRKHGPAAMEVEFVATGEPPSEDATETRASESPKDELTPEAQALAPPRPQSPEQPKEEEKKEEEELVAVPTPERTPPEDAINKQAVTQRSQNPDEPPPDDARFIAKENSRVENETVASVTNYQRDDTETSVGRHAQANAEELGNDAEDEVADLRDMEGHEGRTATEDEAQADRPRESPTEPPPMVASRGNDRSEGEVRERAGESDEGQRARESATATDEPPSTVQIKDAFGTFTVARPSARSTEPGEGTVTQEARAGDGGRGADRRRSGQAGRGKGLGENGANLRVTWSQFEQVMGADQLRREREAYAEERRSRRRGSSHNERWNEFRSAIENFVPNVRPGNQTALNAAASPFAEYLAHVHRRIHREFADRFLAGLPAMGTNELADQSLMTELEIILNRDGTIHRVGVVRTSGFLPFDYGAFAAVMKGQPYPEAPQQILSGDSRVYFHWGFYRNHRQCGTFNAEPYILPEPPGSSRQPSQPLQDRPEWGGVVPRGAKPSFGTGQVPRGGDSRGTGDSAGDGERRRDGDRPSPEKSPARPGPSNRTRPEHPREPSRVSPPDPHEGVIG